MFFFGGEGAEKGVAGAYLREETANVKVQVRN